MLLSTLIILFYLSLLATIGFCASIRLPKGANSPSSSMAQRSGNEPADGLDLQQLEQMRRHLGGRELGPVTTALSAHASDMSAWLFLVLPMMVYLKGSEAFWIALGLFVGMALNWLLIAGKLRRRTEEAKAYNLSTWIHCAFPHLRKGKNEQDQFLEYLCALMTMCFMFFYLVAGLQAMGILFQQLFLIPFAPSIYISLGVIFAYTSVGGYRAIAAIDLFQGLFLLAVIIAIPIYTMIAGSQSLSLISEHASLRQLTLHPFSASLGARDYLQHLITALSWAMGYMGMPHILNKFMGINKPSQMRIAIRVGLLWHALALTSALAIGTLSIAYFPPHIHFTTQEGLFVDLVSMLFSKPVVAWIFCAIIAANISTIDSQLHVASSQFADFFLQPLLQALGLLPKSRTKKAAETLRESSIDFLSVALVALPALALAITKSASLAKLVEIAWNGLGGSFGPLVFVSLYPQVVSKKQNLGSLQAKASLVASFSTIWIWEVFLRAALQESTGLDLPPLLPAFTASLLAMRLSLLCSRKAEESPA